MTHRLVDINTEQRPQLPALDSDFTPPAFPGPRPPLRDIDRSEWRTHCQAGTAQIINDKSYITESRGAISRLVRVNISN